MSPAGSQRQCRQERPKERESANKAQVNALAQEQELQSRSKAAQKRERVAAGWDQISTAKVSGKKALGRARCLGEETARVMGITMAQAVAEVLGTQLVNWHHGLQLVRDGGFKPQGEHSLSSKGPYLVLPNRDTTAATLMAH